MGPLECESKSFPTENTRLIKTYHLVFAILQ